MNERIKELAKQSGVCFVEASVDYFGDRYRAFVTTDKMDFEQFAELIVKECIKVAEPNYMSITEDSAYYVEESINRIKKHFGIK